MEEITQVIQDAMRLSEVWYIIGQKKKYFRKGRKPWVWKYHVFQYQNNWQTKNIYIKKSELAEVRKLVLSKKREFRKINRESKIILAKYIVEREKYFMYIEQLKQEYLWI